MQSERERLRREGRRPGKWGVLLWVLWKNFTIHKRNFRQSLGLYIQVITFIGFLAIKRLVPDLNFVERQCVPTSAPALETVTHHGQRRLAVAFDNHTVNENILRAHLSVASTLIALNYESGDSRLRAPPLTWELHSNGSDHLRDYMHADAEGYWGAVSVKHLDFGGDAGEGVGMSGVNCDFDFRFFSSEVPSTSEKLEKDPYSCKAMSVEGLQGRRQTGAYTRQTDCPPLAYVTSGFLSLQTALNLAAVRLRSGFLSWKKSKETTGEAGGLDEATLSEFASSFLRENLAAGEADRWAQFETAPSLDELGQMEESKDHEETAFHVGKEETGHGGGNRMPVQETVSDRPSSDYMTTMTDSFGYNTDQPFATSYVKTERPLLTVLRGWDDASGGEGGGGRPARRHLAGVLPFSSSSVQGVQFVAEQFPEHAVSRSALAASGLQQLVPVYVLLAFSSLLQFVLVNVASEKEKRLKEILLTAGLSSRAFWLSWLLFYILFSLPLSFVASALVWWGEIMGKADLSLLFVLFTAYLAALIGMGLCLSAFYDTKRAASSMSVLTNALPNLLVIPLASYAKDWLTGPAAWGLFILPSLGFSVAILQGTDQDPKATFSLSRLFEPSHAFLLRALLMLCLDAALFLSLTLLIDRHLARWRASMARLGRAIRRRLRIGRRDARQVNDPQGRFSFSTHSRDRSGMSRDCVEDHPVPPGACVMVSVRDLRKEFDGEKARSADGSGTDERAGTEDGPLVAVAGLSLHICSHEIFALLGHNGAGKTTTLSMLTGLLPPSEGDAWICGNSLASRPDAARACLSVCPQENVFFEELTVEEHLRFFAGLKGLGWGSEADEEIRSLAQSLGIVEKLPSKATTLSGGQKRRVWIAIALLGDPPVVFLDEPTTGLDPFSRRQVWKLIQERKREKGTCVVLTTHHMEEADLLADRKAVLSKGRLACLGSSLFLKAKMGVGYALEVEVSTQDPDAIERLIQTVKSVVPSATVPHVPRRRGRGAEKGGDSTAERERGGDEREGDEGEGEVQRREPGEMSRPFPSDGDGGESPLLVTVVFALPLSASEKFGTLLDSLEEGEKSGRLPIRGLSVSASTLEEVFLRLEEGGGMRREGGSADVDESESGSEAEGGTGEVEERETGETRMPPRIRGRDGKSGRASFSPLGQEGDDRDDDTGDGEGRGEGMRRETGTDYAEMSPSSSFSPSFRSRRSFVDEGGGQTGKHRTSFVRQLFAVLRFRFSEMWKNKRLLFFEIVMPVVLVVIASWLRSTGAAGTQGSEIQNWKIDPPSLPLNDVKSVLNATRVHSDSGVTGGHVRGGISVGGIPVILSKELISRPDLLVEVEDVIRSSNSSGLFFYVPNPEGVLQTDKNVGGEEEEEVEAETESGSSEETRQVRELSFTSVGSVSVSSQEERQRRNEAARLELGVPESCFQEEDQEEEQKGEEEDEEDAGWGKSGVMEEGLFSFSSMAEFARIHRMRIDHRCRLRPLEEGEGDSVRGSQGAGWGAFEWIRGYVNQNMDLLRRAVGHVYLGLPMYLKGERAGPPATAHGGYRAMLRRLGLVSLESVARFVSVRRVSEEAQDPGALLMRKFLFDRTDGTSKGGFSFFPAALVVELGDVERRRRRSEWESVGGMEEGMPTRLSGEGADEGEGEEVAGPPQTGKILRLRLFWNPVVTHVLPFLVATLGQGLLASSAPSSGSGEGSRGAGGEGSGKEFEGAQRILLGGNAGGSRLFIPESVGRRGGGMEGGRNLLGGWGARFLQSDVEVRGQKGSKRNKSEESVRLGNQNSPVSLPSAKFSPSMFFFLYFIGLGVLSMPMGFAYVVKQERTAKAKHLLHVMGLRPLGFWVGTFFANWTLLITGMLLNFVCVVGFNQGLLTGAALTVLALALFCCSFSMLPFAYVMTFAFKTVEGMAQWMQLIVQMMGLIPLILVVSLYTGGLHEQALTVHLVSSVVSTPYQFLGAFLCVTIVTTEANAAGVDPSFSLFFHTDYGILQTLVAALFHCVLLLLFLAYIERRELGPKKASPQALRLLEEDERNEREERERAGVVFQPEGQREGEGVTEETGQTAAAVASGRSARVPLLAVAPSAGTPLSSSAAPVSLQRDPDVCAEEERVLRAVEALERRQGDSRPASSAGEETEEGEELPAARSRQGGTAGRLSPVTVACVRHAYVAKTARDKSQVALRGLSLSVGRGEIFGLLGPNGAGKTSLISLLTGEERPPTAGKAFLMDHSVGTDLEGAFESLGFCPQQDYFGALSVTVKDYIALCLRLRGTEEAEVHGRASEWMRWLEIDDHSGRLLKKCSGGVKRRVNVAAAFIGSPDVVVLDEPSSGMDPRARRRLWRLLQKLSERRDCAVLLTTHSMEEADALCDRLCVLVNGRAMCLGSALSIKRKYGGGCRLEMQLRTTRGEEEESTEETDVSRAKTFVDRIFREALAHADIRVPQPESRGHVDGGEDENGAPSTDSLSPVLRERFANRLVFELPSIPSSGSSLAERGDGGKESMPEGSERDVATGTRVLSYLFRALQKQKEHDRKDAEENSAGGSGESPESEVQENRNEARQSTHFGLVEYSLSQPSLEQVFIAFAKQQHEHPT